MGMLPEPKTRQKPARIMILILSVFLTVFTITACEKTEQPNQSGIVTFQMSPSTNGVEDFIRLLVDTEYAQLDSSKCYNVTPRDISDRFDFNIFKFDSSCESFLLFKNKVYPLGGWFGGYGATSFAVTDYNADGHFELFFTYSSGSGMHRSQAGYFDTANEETVTFDFVNWGSDSVLKTDGNHTLGVYNADCNVKSFVDIELTAENKLASILWDAEKISLVEETEQ